MKIRFNSSHHACSLLIQNDISLEKALRFGIGTCKSFERNTSGLFFNMEVFTGKQFTFASR